MTLSRSRFCVRVIAASILFIVIIFPTLASAQTALGFLNCNGPDCSACNVVYSANKLIVWLVGMLFVVFAVLMVKAGFGLVTSGGNKAALDSAKSTFTNAIIGLIILLSAWIIVDTMIRGLGVTNVDRSGPLPWSEVQCQSQTVPTEGVGNSLANGVGAGWGTSTANIGTGNAAIVNFAEAMRTNNCVYNQSLRNGCQGNPGYTDCSDLVNVAYQRAGCRSPGVTTAQQYPNGRPVGDQATLQAGDALVYNTGGAGHVVICQNSGCSSVIHASGTGRNIVVGNSSSYLARADIRAIRSSDYCN
jgi:Type IV secretion system pilin/NlpC/P60 family